MSNLGIILERIRNRIDSDRYVRSREVLLCQLVFHRFLIACSM